MPDTVRFHPPHDDLYALTTRVRPLAENFLLAGDGATAADATAPALDKSRLSANIDTTYIDHLGTDRGTTQMVTVRPVPGAAVAADD